jgi:hypothetical protein
MQHEYFIIGDPYKLIHVAINGIHAAINENHIVEDQHAYISREN